MNSKEKVLICKGIDRVKQGRLDEALELYDKVLELNPANTEAWNNRGVTLFRMGRLEEALECSNRALEIEPNNLEALRNMGFILKTMGRFDEALECYDAVLKVGAEASDIESKAMILVAIGRLRDAIEVVREAIKTVPVPSSRLEDDLKGLMSLQEQEAGNQAGNQAEKQEEEQSEK